MNKPHKIFQALLFLFIGGIGVQMVISCSSNSGGNDPGSNEQNKTLGLYCDYGPVTQYGGGCFEMEHENDCNLQWGEVVEVCGNYSTQSSSSVISNSSSSLNSSSSSSSAGQMVFCEHLNQQSGRVCQELSLAVCNNLVNAGAGQIIFSCRYEYMTDSRNGNSYRTIKIGTQTWMAENLNYYVAGSVCYDNNPANCTENGRPKYGRLYDWATAINLASGCNTSGCEYDILPKHKGICPTDWHLPSNAEWDELLRYVDGMSGTSSPYNSTTAGKYLKAMSGWEQSGNGTDTHGFSALPGGFGFSGGFSSVGYNGGWWSSSENDEYAYSNRAYAYTRNMSYANESVEWNSFAKSNLFSIRCIKDY